MRILFLLVILGSQTVLFGQNPRQQKLLKQAYSRHSDSLLRMFLNNWARESRPVGIATRTKIKNDTLDNLYQVYNAFYKKDRIAFNRYLLLQDRIEYQVIDSIITETKSDYYYTRFDVGVLQDSLSKYYERFTTIQPFYPKLNLPRSKILLLTKGYRDILEAFLDTTIESERYYNEKTMERAHSDNKIRFLGKYLETVGRHWGHFFDYMSFPEIDRVMFDRTLTKAILSYGLSGKGGIAYLEKNNGKWELIEERITISQ